MKLEDSANQVIVSTSGGRFTFDKATGLLADWQSGGMSLLQPGGGPQLYAYRAPHLNDDHWASGGWKSRGLDQLQFKPARVEAVALPDGAAQVRLSGQSMGKNNFAFAQATTYTVFGDGSVALDMTVLPQSKQRFVLPRIGVRFC